MVSCFSGAGVTVQDQIWTNLAWRLVRLHLHVGVVALLCLLVVLVPELLVRHVDSRVGLVVASLVLVVQWLVECVICRLCPVPRLLPVRVLDSRCWLRQDDVRPPIYHLRPSNPLSHRPWQGGVDHEDVVLV